jgi:serine/threonine protein kinase
MTHTATRLAVALGDRYHIERELGTGGMATVYLAQDLRHHRQVAIKVLKPELAAVIGAERFLSEIRTTANLQHPATAYRPARHPGCRSARATTASRGRVAPLPPRSNPAPEVGLQ